MKKLIRIEYWSEGDICGFGYSTNYKSVIYVPAIIHEYDYPYSEEGVENGDMEFIPTFQKVVKEYITSSFLVTPSQRNALELVQLHEYIKITIEDKVQLVTNFRVEGAKSVEGYEYTEIKLRFQIKYDISRSLKIVEPISALSVEYKLPAIEGIYPSVEDITSNLYDGMLVVISGVASPNIYEYSSSTATFIATEYNKENYYTTNTQDNKQYYFSGLNWYENAQITAITLVSGTTYAVSGTSRMGYIRLKGSNDGGDTYTTLIEDYSGVFNSTGIEVDLAGYDLIQAEYYEHGGNTYIGSSIATPTSTEYLTIIQDLEKFETDIGSFSVSQNFTIKGTGLESTDVVITAPAGYHVSVDNITFVDSITITYSGGIPLTTIYVRIIGEASGYYSGYITLEVNNKTYNVFVEGDVVCNIIWISDYLDIINGEVIQETIEDKLDYLLETKSDIAEAIEEVGGTIEPTYTLRDYADKIKEIACIWEEPFEF